MSRLWYQKPAEVWEEALPLGNGRMGAMVFGGIRQERIQVNEESIWYGGPVDRINPDALEHLEREEWVQLFATFTEEDRKMAAEIAREIAVRNFGKDIYFQFSLL